MRVNVVQASDLSRAQIALWKYIQNSDRLLANPFFSPEFTIASNKVRRNAFVGIVELDGEICGIFPFERRRRGKGGPVGGPLSDYQGVITFPDTPVDAGELIRACKIEAYDFDHMLADQATFTPFFAETRGSPYLDLAQGYDAYAEGRRQAGSRFISKTETKRRKLEQAAGPLRFEADSVDPKALKWLMQLKSQQYVRTGCVDVFAYDWVVQLIENIHATRTRDFAGILSTLHAGDTLIAAHFGMRSRTVWHHWFPTYHRDFQKYSPGDILTLEMAKSAESLGLHTLDLGRGDQEYKLRMATGSHQVARGDVVVTPFAVLSRALWRATVATSNAWYRGTYRLPMGPLTLFPRRTLQRLENYDRFVLPRRRKPATQPEQEYTPATA